jgi:beta-1,4-N-acetylglucosaminyltransferase
VAEAFLMRAFITVGSTRFDALVQGVLTTEIISSLARGNYLDVVIQSGNSDFQPDFAKENLQAHGVTLETWKFKPSLDADFARADLVISHAGLSNLGSCTC